MKIISDKFFVMIGIMMIIPFFCYMLLPSPYDTISAMGSNLVMIFVFRKMITTMSGKILGSKIKFQCLVCSGTKFDGNGICNRCGSKQKRPI